MGGEEAGVYVLMRGLLYDLRVAVRALRRAPWRVGVAVVTLALGTGLTTAVFAAAYGILVRPLPYAQPDQLALILVKWAIDDVGRGVNLHEFESWQAQLDELAALAAYTSSDYTLRDAGDARVVRAALISDTFFEVLRGAPVAGRVFGAADQGAAAVVSEPLYRELAWGGSDVIGRGVRVGEHTFTVVGVMAANVAVPSDRVDLWLPASAAPDMHLFESTRARRFHMLARLRPGFAIEPLRAAAEAALVRTDSGDPDAPADRSVVVTGLHERLAGPVRPVLRVFMAAAVLVLVVSCVNVGSLLVTHAMTRQRDTAIRLALGAPAARILRGFLAEGAIIALLGSSLGAVVALVAAGSLRALAGGLLPRTGEVVVDAPVLLASLGVAGVVAVVTGAIPGFQALRAEATIGSRRGGFHGSLTHGRVGAGMIVVQIAISVVLVAGAGLLGRTVVRLLRTDTGVRPGHAVTMKLMLAETIGLAAPTQRPFITEMLRQTRELPGVEYAGVINNLPPQAAQIEFHIRIIDQDRDDTHKFGLVAASSGSLQALGARLVNGRAFEPGDSLTEGPVVVVSESAAHALFGDQPAPGRELPLTFRTGRPGRARIVGVVGDIKYAGLQSPARGTLYLLWDDLPVGVVYLVVRTTGEPLAVVPAIRRVVRQLRPGQAVAEVRTLQEVVTGPVAERRFQALVAVSFAAVTLFLALVGLAAALSAAVADRRRELAIRAALGAGPGRNLRRVVRHGAALTMAGLLVGLGAALLAGRGLASLLYGVSSHDPLTLAAAATAVGATSMVASWLPARRAAAIDPAELLRSE